jgi:hypothetical protein
MQAEQANKSLNPQQVGCTIRTPSSHGKNPIQGFIRNLGLLFISMQMHIWHLSPRKRVIKSQSGLFPTLREAQPFGNLLVDRAKHDMGQAHPPPSSCRCSVTAPLEHASGQ